MSICFSNEFSLSCTVGQPWFACIVKTGFSNGNGPRRRFPGTLILPYGLLVLIATATDLFSRSINDRA